MALYRAKAPDGTQIQFEATSLSDAKSIYKERYGKTAFSIGKVPTGTPTTPTGVGVGAGAGVIGTELPTMGGTLAPEDWAADYERRYGTAPTTTPTTPREKIEASAAELRAKFVEAPPEGVSQEWIEAFERYQEFVKANPNLSIPIYKDVNDYMLHEAEWLQNLPYYQAGYGQELIDSYTDFGAYASKYGNLEDEYPKNLLDYLENPDKFQQQLDLWKQEAGPEAVGFTDAQIREFNAYKQYYYQYGKPGELVPADIGDFIANLGDYQKQLAIWQQQAAEVERYEVDPAEAARRREWRYQREVVGAGEAYREQPSYQEPFAAWMSQQGGMSGAFRGFVESEYPSLRTRHVAGLPQLTGYPTPTAARAEAARRERGFEAWLPQQTPGLYQEYMGQRPWERGVRYATQSPTHRLLNF